MTEEQLQKIYGDDWREVVAENERARKAHEAEMKALIASNRDMPPPWAEFPHIHPYSIGWRMGAGESYAMDFYKWWESKQGKWRESQKIAYFKRWMPRPAWTQRVISLVWNPPLEDLDDDEKIGVFIKRLSRHGFASLEEFRADIESTDWSHD